MKINDVIRLVYPEEPPSGAVVVAHADDVAAARTARAAGTPQHVRQLGQGYAHMASSKSSQHSVTT